MGLYIYIPWLVTRNKMKVTRSNRCCDMEGSFGTVCLSQEDSEIQITLRGAPCCSKEFNSFLAILSKTRTQLDTSKPFYLLYNLETCTLNRSLLKAQEDVLHGAAACAIVTSNSIAVRRIISIITAVRKTKIQIFGDVAKGTRWLAGIRMRCLRHQYDTSTW
jgi:hypothetical protein